MGASLQHEVGGALYEHLVGIGDTTLGGNGGVQGCAHNTHTLSVPGELQSSDLRRRRGLGGGEKEEEEDGGEEEEEEGGVRRRRRKG